MYRLQVYHPGDVGLVHWEDHHNAAEVLKRIPALLEEHLQCERIVVTFGEAQLFVVDCKGNSTRG